jgi:beta-lactamase regulating signal transducer with metallopeptidase domain
MNTLSDFAVEAVRLAVNFTIIGAVPALSVALTFRFARSVHPRIRYAIAVAAFCAAVMMPVLMTFRIAEKLEPSAIIVKNSEAENLEALMVQPDLVERLSTEIVSDEVSNRWRLEVSSTLSIGFLAVWFLVAFLLVIREIAGHSALIKARRKWNLANENVREKFAVPRGVPLYLSDDEKPFAIGVFRPAIILPSGLLADLSIEAARQIARHELNHIQWRDPSVNAILRLVRAVFWINLPLWFLERMIRLEREAAADFAVVKSYNFDSKSVSEYANALVAVVKWSAAKRRRFNFVATEIGGQTRLEKRVRRLFQTSTRPKPSRIIFALFVFCASFSGIYFLPLASSAKESFFQVNAGEERLPEISGNDNSSTFPTNIAAESIAPKAQITGEQKPEKLAPKAAGETIQSDLSVQPDLPSENTFAETEASAIVQPTPPQNFEASPIFLRDGMASVGYSNLSEEELNALRKADVSHFFVREMASVGYTNLSLKTLIRLRQNSVSAAYVREMRAFGYDNLSAEMLSDFRWHGVSSVYIKEMASLGYGDLPAETILAFRRNSVSSVYINEMKPLVKGGISAKNLVEMKWLGVDRKFIEQLSALGYERLTANQLTDMKQFGVTIAFIEKITARDNKKYSPNDLISMRMNGEK